MPGSVRPVTDERDGLLAFLEQQRDSLRISAHGLTDEQAKETEAIVAEIGDLDHPVPVPPAPWFPDDVKEWSLRWVLLHLIEETARHAGHADIVRESLDGQTFYPLMAAAEGWPSLLWESD